MRREGSNSAADHEPTGLKILGFNSQGVWLQSVLDCASEMLCISVPQCRTIIAASVNGEVNCWEMDLQWRSVKAWLMTLCERMLNLRLTDSEL